jgi:hypothetical protein
MTPEPENPGQATAGPCQTCGKPAGPGCRHCLPCLQHFVRQFGSYEYVQVAGLGDEREIMIGKN